MKMKETYQKTIAPKLMKEFKLSNIMEVPRLKKISVNSGMGSYRDSREAVDSLINDLSLITGQRPFPRKSRKSEAGFKMRKNEVVGDAVTLRGDRMWAFLDKFLNVVLPRVRDFRGLNTTSFDENGNYSVGLREHVIFPEVNPNTVKGIRGLQVTVVMEGNNKDHNLALLRELGFPFKKDERKSS